MGLQLQLDYAVQLSRRLKQHIHGCLYASLALKVSSICAQMNQVGNFSSTGRGTT
jgi:hypothetical protein